MLASCSPTRRLAEGEILLVKNQIELDGVDIDKDDLREILKQEPNKKILPFWRFHLQAYNLPDPEKLESRQLSKDRRLEEKNERRLERGKKPKKERRTRGEWLREVVGEPPVLLDTNLVHRSSSQLSTYLIKKGYFDNTVRDSIAYLPKKLGVKKRAEVYYFVEAQEPYIIDTIEYRIAQDGFRGFVFGEEGRKTLTAGQVFDISKMDKERERVTALARDNGYYDFSRDYIRFDVDSALTGDKVRLIYRLERPKERVASLNDSLVAVPHEFYRLGKVYFNFAFPGMEGRVDTVRQDDWIFLNMTGYPLKKKVLIQNTFLFSGDQYRQSEVLRTYRRLSALPIITHVSIRFVKNGEGELDTYIDLVPAQRQNVAVEATGTNSSGFLGVEGSVTYRHRNVFKGAETLELGVKGALQAQALITDNVSVQGDGTADNVDFNTREFGPTLSLTIPKFLLPISQDRFSRSINPSTVINSGYSFQFRPDYTREVANVFVGYAWNETNLKRHRINPLEVSIIRIDKSEGFQQRLDELNDQFLSDSYENHFITSSSYSFIYNDQERRSKRRSIFYQGNVELSGNLLRAAYDAFGSETDTLGSHRIFGIRFSNYFKTFNDLRFYRTLNEHSSLAFRAFAGVGVPLQNLNVLPFSKSFFSGGANGLRAWRARTIGPGGFFEPTVTYDKIGDVQLEGNIEYRFDLIDYSEGAFFLDMGNIWLLNENKARPNGEFSSERFLGEIAFGAGFGLRLDFDYFIIRFDLAAQIKDPALDPGERWIWEPKTQYNRAISLYNESLPPTGTSIDPYSLRLNFNLGIGYPF